MAKWHKVTLVVFGAMLLSTVAIQAGDILQGIEGNLAGSVVSSESPCGQGAVQVNLATGPLCVDVYEASPGPQCPSVNILSGPETQANLNEPACGPVSVSGAIPWRHIAQVQAAAACARVGKRLPTPAEWHALALAHTNLETCRVEDSAPHQTGAAACVTAAGIHDMVGNVWEWVEGQVVNGVYAGRQLPESGYVAAVDIEGIVLETSSEPQEVYGNDYAKTATQGTFGIIRGGFYGSGSDGGVFAQNVAVDMSLRTEGIGFRCVRGL